MVLRQIALDRITKTSFAIWGVAVAWKWGIFIAVLGQIVEAKADTILFVVCMHKTPAFIVTIGASLAKSVGVTAPSSLHAPSRLYTAHKIRCDAIFVSARELAAVWIASRKVEEIDTGKNDQETSKEGNCVYSVRGIETSE